MHNCIQFVQTEEQLQLLVAQEEIKTHRANHSKLLTEVNRLKADLETLQQELQHSQDERKDKVQDTDAASVSTSKSSSSSAVRAQIQLSRLKVEQEKAETMAKLSTLKKRRELELKKQELERQNQELRWQEEEFELHTQISIQEAQEEVRRKIEQELDGVQPTRSTQPPPPSRSTAAQVTGNQVVPSAEAAANGETQRCQSASPNQDGATAQEQQPTSSNEVLLVRADQLRLNLLPALEPEKFRGNVEQLPL